MRGIYIPFWIYDADTLSNYSQLNVSGTALDVGGAGSNPAVFLVNGQTSATVQHFYFLVNALNSSVVTTGQFVSPAGRPGGAKC